MRKNIHIIYLFMLCFLGLSLATQGQSVSIIGERVVNAGTPVTYRVNFSGPNTSCVNYTWSITSGNGTIQGPRNQTTVTVIWAGNGGTLRVRAQSLGISPIGDDPILFDGNNSTNCIDFDVSSQINVTVNCQVPITFEINCVLGTIVAKLPFSTSNYRWSDGTTSEGRIVKDGEIIGVICQAAQNCSCTRRIDITVDASTLSNSCNACLIQGDRRCISQ